MEQQEIILIEIIRKLLTRPQGVSAREVCNDVDGDADELDFDRNPTSVIDPGEYMTFKIVNNEMRYWLHSGTYSAARHPGAGVYIPVPPIGS